MKYSLNWLRELCDFEVDVEALLQMLTQLGFEAEGQRNLSDGWGGILVAEVASVEPMPDSGPKGRKDKLKQVRLLDGQGVRLVVSGAPNLAVGQRVPLATEGSVVRGQKIGVETFAGVKSEGMLCSELELGLSDDHKGVCLLPQDWDIGKPLRDTPLGDTIIELSVTPNRPDVLCHLGLAREIAAGTSGRVRKPRFVLREEASDIGERVSVDIIEAQACRRYLARVVTQVKVGPSPLWMRARLHALGQRSINNVVDVTNWVMLELGQPLHAFDLGRVVSSGKQRRISVRRAAAEERVVTLDSVDRPLSEDDLVIADSEQVLAIAGVMGGESSEISPSTSDVLLEAAHFEGPGVYQTAKRLSLLTEAANRFWRGTDLEGLPLASERAAWLLAECASGKVCRGFLDIYPRRRPATEVSVRPKRASAYLGVEVTAEDLATRLSRLELTLKSRTDQGLTFGVPSFRVDLLQEVDLIEEVARLTGYDHIPETIPSAGGPFRSLPEGAKDYTPLRQDLRGFGLSEVINYSFGDASGEALFRPQAVDEAVHLQNPMSDAEGVLRTSLVPGLLRNVLHNVSHQVNDIRLFELGRIFLPWAPGAETGPKSRDARDALLPSEPEKLAVALAGGAAPLGWGMSQREVDFFDLKRVVEWLCGSRGFNVDYDKAALLPALHPEASAWVRVRPQRSEAATLAKGGAGQGSASEDFVVIGFLGQVHPRVLHGLGVPRPVFVAELDLAPFADKASAKKYTPLPRFPVVRRDLAFLVAETQPLGEVLKTLSSTGTLVREARVFDVYKGKPIRDNFQSVAVALFFYHDERTLTDEEVQAEVDAMWGKLKERHAIERRE